MMLDNILCIVYLRLITIKSRYIYKCQILHDSFCVFVPHFFFEQINPDFVLLKYNGKESRIACLFLQENQTPFLSLKRENANTDESRTSQKTAARFHGNLWGNTSNFPTATTRVLLNQLSDI